MNISDVVLLLTCAWELVTVIRLCSCSNAYLFVKI
jgi:hypothetical protein